MSEHTVMFQHLEAQVYNLEVQGTLQPNRIAIFILQPFDIIFDVLLPALIWMDCVWHFDLVTLTSFLGSQLLKSFELIQ